MATKISGCQSGTIVPWVFWKAKLALKNTKVSITSKKALRRQWNKIPQSHFRAACDGFIDRVKAIIRAKGGHSNKSKLILKFDFIADIFCFHSIRFRKKIKTYDVLHCCSFSSHPVLLCFLSYTGVAR